MGVNRVSPTNKMTDKETDEEQVANRTMPQRIGNSFRKFLLLIWKNTFLIRKRHWVVTLLEILIPLLLFVLMAVLRASAGAFGVEPITEPTRFDEVSEKYLIPYILPGSTINYAPVNNFTTDIIRRTAMKCDIHQSVLKGFESENAVVNYFNKLTLNESVPPYNFMGVIFEGDAALPGVTVPDSLKYKLRLSTSHIFNTDMLFRSIQFPGPDMHSDAYLTSGFTPLQVFLDKSYIEMIASKEAGGPVRNFSDEVFTQKMPYPPYLQDYGYSSVARYMLPSIATFSFITLCIAVVKRVVEEKQTGARELMRLMGMEGWALWGSWLVDALLIRLISLALVVALLKTEFAEETGAVLRKTDGSVLYFMLLVYTVPAVISCFAVSSFFSRPTLAMTVSIVLWIASQSLPSYYAENISLNINGKMAMVLLPNMGLYYMFNIMSDLEARDVGAQWSNFFESGSGAPGDISLGLVVVMFIIDSFLYALITWYVGSISPGQYGIAQPWYFIFSRDYWLSKVKNKNKHEDFVFETNPNFEKPLSQNCSEPGVGVFIRGLTKTYPGMIGRQPVRAVQGLSLDLYKGEITALLGHNGAGKTTTMSILTGMIGASGGSVNILGHDLTTELSAVRSSLGLCPQHNLLFKDLTVREHLIFFAMLKGNSYKCASKEAGELVDQVQLKVKWNNLASTLSGGMQRKLSLAIALIGGSKVLMLDEPTSGLDPEARREIWDLLLGMRGQRTILLSTHFMEEADVLGDTIAIMAHGKVHCCGSSLYLKRVFGTGYHLTLMRKPDCNISAIAEQVQQVVPEAELAGVKADQVDGGGHHAGPITFRLPSNRTDKFADMLDKLENERERLGIANVSMSVTTMEEVFLKVGELTEGKCEEEAEYDVTDTGSPVHEHDSTNGSVEGKNSLHLKKSLGLHLLMQQMKALVIKKWLFTQRRWIHLVFQVAMPILLMLVTISVSISAIQISAHSEPPRLFALHEYGKPNDLRVLYSATGGAEASIVAQNYEQLIRSTASISQIPVEQGGVQEGLLREGAKSIAQYRKSYIVAGSFNETQNGYIKVTALYSSNALHASPISMNLISNALLGYHTTGKHKITTTNHPLPTESPYQYISHQTTVSAAIAVIWLTLAPLGWLFAAAAAITLPLQERICGSRQLQVMAGCSHTMVWVSYLLVDVAISTILALLTVMLVPILDTNNTFSQSSELGVLFLLFSLYGMSGSAFAYMMSFSKNTTAGAYALLVIVNILVAPPPPEGVTFPPHSYLAAILMRYYGIVVNMIVYILEFPGLGDSSYRAAANTMRTLFGLLLPHSALASALAHFGSTAAFNAQCRNMPASIKNFLCGQGAFTGFTLGGDSIACCENLCAATDSCLKPVPYLAWSGSTVGGEVQQFGPIGREVFFLAIGIPIWLGLSLLLDCGLIAQAKEFVLRILQGKFHPSDEADGMQLDEDVACERNRVRDCIQNCSEDKPVLTVQGLAKDFGVPIRNPRFSAVKGVSFAVTPGECFGLLGVNGAGKTTTFRMLTGAEAPTHGDARLLGARLRGDRRRYLSDLGYCPQFDAQLGVLTGRETLDLYANLRGLPKKKIHSEIYRWLSMLGLLEYASRPSSSYSGGNRRKLSAAMALIGEPPLALLDEPTSGVDPIARRRLWQVLERCQQGGQAIVLTSHSMDECEALCSRLGIMVGGQLMCLGATSHLKHKFGQGFTLMVKFRSVTWAASQECLEQTGSAVRRLKQDIEERLSPCKLRDAHQGLLHYHITDSNKRWSHLFSVMEQLKKDHADTLEDYTISETTLEQVFLSFARAGSHASTQAACEI